MVPNYNWTALVPFDVETNLTSQMTCWKNSVFITQIRVLRSTFPESYDFSPGYPLLVDWWFLDTRVPIAPLEVLVDGWYTFAAPIEWPVYGAFTLRFQPGTSYAAGEQLRSVKFVLAGRYPANPFDGSMGTPIR